MDLAPMEASAHIRLGALQLPPRRACSARTVVFSNAFLRSLGAASPLVAIPRQRAAAVKANGRRQALLAARGAALNARQGACTDALQVCNSPSLLW